MKKKHLKTRHALLMSCISLMTCFAMLVGATFAWFTDSVTSGVNRIVAGNLDVELKYKDNVETNYTDVTATTKLFNSAANGKLWEPGAMAYETFKVSNNGTLALKYQFALNTVDYNTVTRTSGSYDLRDVLKIAVVETAFDATARPDPATLDFKSWSEYANSAAFTGEILPGEDTAQEKTVVIWWPDTNSNDVDNRYNLKDKATDGWTLNKTNNGKDELYIDLGITLVATQLQNESDSFGPDYDAASTYPSASVEGATFVPTTETVSAAVTAGETTTMTAAVAPAAGKATEVVFSENALNEGEATLKVETMDVESASAKSFFVVDNSTQSAVATVSLTLDTTNGTVFNGNTGTATITTYIAPGLNSVNVVYNGTGAAPTGVTYESSTGKLTFTTTHFSEYVVTSADAAYNETTKKGYADLADALGSAVNGGSVVLLRDVTLTGTWAPIGTSDHPFTGTFDGKGHTINGLKIVVAERTDSDEEFGMFRYTENATIKNLKLAGASGDMFEKAGLLIGNAKEELRIENVEIDAASTMKGVDSVGGFVGITTGTGLKIFKNCVNHGTVSATDNDNENRAGGFVGGARDRRIVFDNCLFDGKIIGGWASAFVADARGADAGREYTDAGIYFVNCRENATIEYYSGSKNDYRGSFLGYVIYSKNLYLKDCTNTYNKIYGFFDGEGGKNTLLQIVENNGVTNSKTIEKDGTVNENIGLGVTLDRNYNISFDVTDYTWIHTKSEVSFDM